MRASDYLKISKDPATLLAAIPRKHDENIAFRKDLHPYLASDVKAKTDFLAKAFFDPRIWFSACLWTFNPQAKHGYRHIPFILWPHQEPAVLAFKDAIDNEKSKLSKKSRKQGATYIILGTFLLYWLVSPGSRFLLGSRREELVDNGCEIVEGDVDEGATVIGSEESLFYKLLYMLSTIPVYLRPQYYKKHCFLQNLEMDTGFKGETTNIGFGKGFRGTAVMVDEAAQIDPKLAQWIIENLGATANCNLFNSTPGPWGESHPYSKLIKANPDSVVTLDWKDNPTCNQGLYRSPREGYVEIADVAYYVDRYPTFPANIKPNMLVSIEDLKDTYPFVADGGISCWSQYRSVWCDKEWLRPENTSRGMAQNVYMLDTGAVDAFFDYELILKLRDRIKKPEHCGDVEYKRDGDEIMDTRFCYGGRDAPLYWWGSLDNRRPNQRHNYAVGCDISKGTGASNSVCAIKDCNTNEIVGLYVNPYIKVSDFAEKVVAICHWVGGQVPALLNWERTGMSEFYDRVSELGYYNLYVDKPTGKRKTKLDNKYGWNSTGGIDGTKRGMLNGLSSSLSEGCLEHQRFNPCRVYDEQFVNEAEAYVNYEGKIDVGPVSLQTETSGAKAAHGDRVIAVGLADLASKDQKAADENAIINIPEGSFMDRMIRVEAELAREQADGKQWLY